MATLTATRCAVHEYARSVLAGEIVTGSLVRLAAERHLRDLEHGHERGLRFDEAAADRAIGFMEQLPHIKGEWAKDGSRMILEPWQRFIVGSLFGWKRADGLRRFRVSYCELARKNGKSFLGSGIGLKLGFFDDEPGAEVYSAAVKREQAKIVWGDARAMVLKTPGLRQRITALVGNLHSETTNSQYMPLGADADSMDGLNIHAAIVDELHAHKTRAIVDVLETATGARRQPLIFYITTAGSDRTSVCYERHEHAISVLRGTIEDDTLFAFIAAFDDGDDPFDEANWPKANPNLGVSVKIDDLRRKAERAKVLPTELNAFLRLHGCVWTQQIDRWIPLELWDAQAGEKIDEEALAGRLCYAGLDLSATRDLTAAVYAFPHDDDPEHVDILARVWCPEAWVYANENRYGAQYQAWARDGWLTVTDGNEVDYRQVKAQVLADALRFRLADLGIDRLFQGASVGQELAEEGITVTPIGQGFYGMAAPMKELERRLLGKKLHHGGNPILRFAADNFAVKIDPAGNLKPDKSEPQRKIDPMVALVMALDRAMRKATAAVFTWGSV